MGFLWFGKRNMTLLSQTAGVELNSVRNISMSCHALHSNDVATKHREFDAACVNIMAALNAFHGAGTIPAMKPFLASIKEALEILKALNSDLTSDKIQIIKIKNAATNLGRADERLRKEFGKNVVHHFITKPNGLINKESRYISQAFSDTRRLLDLLGQLEQKINTELAHGDQIKSELEQASRAFASLKLPPGGAGNSAIFAHTYAAPLSALDRAMLSVPKMGTANNERGAAFANISNHLYAMQNTFSQLVIETR